MDFEQKEADCTIFVKQFCIDFAQVNLKKISKFSVFLENNLGFKNSADIVLQIWIRRGKGCSKLITYHVQ